MYPQAGQDTLNSMSSMHSLANSSSMQEVHIVKVSGDTVQLEAGPAVPSIFHRVGKSTSTHDDEHVGPPPPSPPASLNADLEDELASPTVLAPSKSEPGSSVIFDEPEPIQERQPSMTSSRFTAAPSSYTPHRSSTSTDTRSSLSTTRAQDTPATEQSTMKATQSSDGYLQPPPVTKHRPTRRNTTGSTSSPKPPRTHTQQFSFGYEEGDVETELASDIQLHAERIRRERLSKRVKAEAEAALTRSETRTTKDDAPLVGNLIGEDHVNYVLMYNMLTGIRIGVSGPSSHPNSL